MGVIMQVMTIKCLSHISCQTLISSKPQTNDVRVSLDLCLHRVALDDKTEGKTATLLNHLIRGIFSLHFIIIF